MKRLTQAAKKASIEQKDYKGVPQGLKPTLILLAFCRG